MYNHVSLCLLERFESSPSPVYLSATNIIKCPIQNFMTSCLYILWGEIVYQAVSVSGFDSDSAWYYFLQARYTHPDILCTILVYLLYAHTLVLLCRLILQGNNIQLEIMLRAFHNDLIWIINTRGFSGKASPDLGGLAIAHMICSTVTACLFKTMDLTGWQQ